MNNASLPVLPLDPPAAPASRDAVLERDARAFYDALSDLIRVYQFRDRDRICCFDVSVTQCYGLEALVHRGPMTLNDLAGHLYLDKSTASRVIDALERKRYVARAPHPRDGRAVLLEVTPEGRELYSRIESGILAEERSLLADFDPEIRQAMTQLVARLARAAAARVDASGGSCCRIGPEAG
jgi:MarR family transcriptional regulator, 2-MHQ and catechol-resistance regulon repressor